MIETCRLKNVVIFVQTILSFVLSRKVTFNLEHLGYLMTLKMSEYFGKSWSIILMVSLEFESVGEAHKFSRLTLHAENENSEKHS